AGGAAAGERLGGGEEVFEGGHAENAGAAQRGGEGGVGVAGGIHEQAAGAECHHRAGAGGGAGGGGEGGGGAGGAGGGGGGARVGGWRESQSSTMPKPISSLPPMPTMWLKPTPFGSAQSITARQRAADWETSARWPWRGFRCAREALRPMPGTAMPKEPG